MCIATGRARPFSARRTTRAMPTAFTSQAFWVDAGRCKTLTVTTRIVVDGFHYPLDWHPWMPHLMESPHPLHSGRGVRL